MERSSRILLLHQLVNGSVKKKYFVVHKHKRYPENKKKVSYSKIRPFVDWWKMVRPMVYLFLRIKK